MSITAESFKLRAMPLALYIHMPWCVKKCPYCDFNSHHARGELPFEDYIHALISDFHESFPQLSRPLKSIFIGGGTPSLFKANHIRHLLDSIADITPLPNEITMEVNPGAIERGSFKDYKAAGVTRISLGAQSFSDQSLLKIGRIHSSDDTHHAIHEIKEAGFERWNLDIMYGLPDQSVEQAMQDLQIATSYNPPHLSWYQLTLEPNTKFYHQRPPLPHEDSLYHMFIDGHQQLASDNLYPYEVSAFSQNQACEHNMNYWEFGDYLGIGAGAHSKITCSNGIFRETRYRSPKDYLSDKPFKSNHQAITPNDLSFEFMLNSLRLTHGFQEELFSERTLLALDRIAPILEKAQAKNLLLWQDGKISPSRLGKLYLNDLMAMFLEDGHSNSVYNQS